MVLLEAKVHRSAPFQLNLSSEPDEDIKKKITSEGVGWVIACLSFSVLFCTHLLLHSKVISRTRFILASVFGELKIENRSANLQHTCWLWSKCSRFRKSELHKANLTGEERTSPLGHKLWHKLRADEGHVQAHPREGSCRGVKVKVKDKELWCWCCSLTVTRKDVQTLVSSQKGLWFCSVASISLPSGRGEGLQPSCSAF